MSGLKPQQRQHFSFNKKRETGRVKMVSSMEREKMLSQKLQLLKAIIRSDAEKKSAILNDALNYIEQLKLKVDEMTKEYDDLMNEIHAAQDMGQVVRVEKLEGGSFAVKVTSEKTQDLLISMLEAFDRMGLEIVQGEIDASNIFDMEAIVETGDETVDVEDITETIYEVLDMTGVKNVGSDDDDDEDDGDV